MSEAEELPTPLVVSVVINFRGLDDTKRCVDSLRNSTYPAHVVLVVDNGSGNGDAAQLRNLYGSRIVLIESSDNRGYGGGANLGIRWALERGASYVWVLNNDTIIEPESLTRLVAEMEQQPTMGAASPQINAPVGPEAPQSVWFAGGSLDLARGGAHHHVVSLERAPGCVLTEFLTGCAMLLRREAIESVGMFWAPLFLFWEDVDLSLRLRRAGWELAVVPAATIHHAVHGSVTTDVSKRYFVRNAVITAARHGTSREFGRAVVVRARRTLRAWVMAALRRRKLPIPETRGFCEGVLIAARHRMSPGRKRALLRPGSEGL